MALRIERKANPLWIFEIYHRRLAIALGSLAFAGWLLAVSGLFLWLNRTPHNQVGWLDLAAPWRWSGLRAKRGDTAIKTALAELKERDYASAYYNLRVGLTRSPGNVDGRVTLARLLAGQDPVRTVAILEEGLPHSGQDPKLITALLGAYATYRMHTRGLSFVDQQLRQTPPPSPEVARLLRRGQIEYLLGLGRTAEATQAFLAIPAGAPAGSEDAVAEIDLELRLGRPAEARRKLEPMLRDPSAPTVVWRQAVDAAVALGDADGVVTALRHLRAAAPTDPGPYLIAFKAWHQLQRVSLRDGAEQDYYRLFKTSDGALQAFAAQAVQLDLPDALARAQRIAAVGRLSQFAFRVHRTELLLRRGDVAGAMRMLQEWENDIETLGPAQRFHPEYIKRLTRAASAGTPDQVAFVLAQLTAARGFASLGSYQLAALVLEKAGNPAGASEVVRAGLQIYPQCDPLLVAQARLAEITRTAAVPVGETTRTAAETAVIPASAVAARARIAELAQRDDVSEARDLLKAIRAQKPAWLPVVDVELSVREVEVAYLAEDPLASRTAARGFLDRYRDDDAVLALVAMAARLDARGQGAKARQLADEIRQGSALPRVQQALRESRLLETTTAPRTQAATLAALDEHLAARRWSDAEQILKLTRENPPDWAAAAAVELRTREVRIRLGLDQRPLALQALKELVVKSGAPRGAAFALVRDLTAKGERENAQLLAREVVRLLPGDQAASRLLQEAEAARPGTP